MLRDMYGISFDPQSSLNQYQQLVNQLREQIGDGRLQGGKKLLSSRELASRLNIARGIVIEAYDQLKMEGYLEAVHGSGTFVRRELVWNSFKPAPGMVRDKRQGKGTDQLLSFVPGMPDMDLFPRRKWMACYQEALEYANAEDLEYAPFSGRWDLRQALARHLSESKGIHCNPANIVITSGSSQAFSLLAQLKRNPGVVIEDPQAEFVYRIFREYAEKLTLVPVDEEGMLPESIPGTKQDWIYVTPSHQFPLGGTLSAERRVALLKKAQNNGAWIIEDDFDSEFRYLGKPVPPLQPMAPERVVYIGTFSKIVSPALRLGFMVLPNALVAEVKELKSRWDFWNEGLQQKAMALFIQRGHLSRHIARAHRSYGQKNAYLKGLIAKNLTSQWKISGDTTGMHLVLNRFNSRGEPEDVSELVQKMKEKGFLLSKGADYIRSGKRSYRHSLLISFGKRSREDLAKLITALKGQES